VKYLALAFLILAVPAYADDSAKPADESKPATTAEQAAPAKPSPPPSEWSLDLDQGDLTTINTCVLELPKKTADPFIAKLNSKLKVVK
jgi:hypothetical protein